MKAFAIKKDNMNKYAKENQIRLNKANTKIKNMDGEEFSYVEIGNPFKSNCIYEIKNINLKLKCDNKLIISIGQGILKRTIAKGLETNIIVQLAEEGSMEILSLPTDKGQVINILNNYSIILLPGGSVFLKTMKPIEEMMLDMEWIEELL